LTVILTPSSLANGGEHRDRGRRTAMLVTTTPGIEGRTVTQYLGVVTAQGVLGVDIDYKSVGDNMLMVSASGTAVKLG
jgi:uncharacterized protein YbjQ (UPF0145 family)